jgi:hypothetical protein
MVQSNSTFGIYITSLVVLFRHKRYLFFILFLTVYPVLLIINRIFLFLDYILVPEFEKAKVKEPVFIMGVNRSGTTFFHKLLAKSNQFSTSKTWDLIVPSLSLRKFLSILSYTLTYFKIDQIEKKNKGHQVKLDNIEEDEMLLFIHKLDSLWVSNHLIPWLKFDSHTKDFMKYVYRDNSKNENRNIRSMLFCKDFFQRQSFLNKNRSHLSKSNPFIFKIDSILRVFPDAKFVFLVRDPLETIPSYFSLQENVKFANLLSDKEIKLLRKETYAEIIEWYRETEKVKSKLYKKQFITLTYSQITNDLENSVKSFYKFTGKRMTQKFKKQVSDFASKKYVKKHQNKTIEDYGFTKKQILNDFDFVYQEYFI